MVLLGWGAPGYSRAISQTKLLALQLFRYCLITSSEGVQVVSQLRPNSVLPIVRRPNSIFRHLLVEDLEKRVVFSIDAAEFMGPLPYRAAVSPDQLWSSTPGVPLVEGKQSYIHPVAYTAVALDERSLVEQLSAAPLEFTELAETSAVQITLPTPDGAYARFRVVASPIMAPELAAQFPEIQTYSGQGIDDPAATVRFDVTPAGFHAQVLSPSGAFYIDPFWHLDKTAYISYFKQDLVRTADKQFVELDDHESEAVFDQEDVASTSGKIHNDASAWQLSKDPDGPTLARSGTQLRVYDLANAATGEYTAFHGGTVALAQAAIVTAVNRVTGIYENELSVRLVLIANNASLVFTDAGSDPYTNDDGVAMLDENQTTIDSIIGNANYDIGHVFSTGGGGVAGLGVVGLTGSKAEGVTGSDSPIGDPFWVDYVAHEMGHQFGGSHTFNSTTGSCAGNRSSGAAYEPGSGSTIQAYAGICGADDLQPNSDPYFHSFSFDQITTVISGGAANSAATIINTGNTVPRVNAGPDYAIPTQTPFVLKAAGTDSNSTDVLTYNWEQRDLGVARTLAAADNGTSPLFRSFNPTLSGDRTFPRLAELLNNTTPIGEKMPTLNRAMDFRVTVRDNRSGGGAVNTDDVLITVFNTGAAFAVTSPNTAVDWAAGSSQTVTWNVAGTTAAPINTANVNIWLSTDGGLTYPLQLASGVANDGSETVTMPNIATAQARIKVEPTNSIYFDISNTNFTVSGGTNTAPTITSFANRLMNWNTSTGSMEFTVGDTQTAASSLVVTASSSNPTLVPVAGFAFGGSGASRTLTVTPAVGQFGTATIYVNVTDAGGLTTTTAFQLFVEGVLSCTPFESFDSVTAPTLPAGWTSSATGVAAVNWATSTTTSDSGANNAFVTDPGGISDSLLTSPALTITTLNRTIQFRNNYGLENGFDGGVMEISVNGGAFTDVITAGGSFTSGGYNSVISSGFSSPIGGRSAWSGNSNGYTTTAVELPASTIGQSVRLRFRMAADIDTSGVGWRVDTIQACGFASPSVLSITATDASKSEGNSGTTPFNFVVSRTGDASAAGTVQYAVTGSGTAPAIASDFGGTLPSGTVSFAAGETSKPVVIDVTGDTQYEGSEGFTVTISAATGGALIDTAAANGLIVDDDNTAPTDLTISQSSIAENVPLASTIGSLATVDSDVADLFTYTLVSGAGDTDNSSFAISGSNLRTAAALNFETKSNYSVRVRSTDQGGLTFEKSFTISVVDLAEFSAPVRIGDGTNQRTSVKNVVVTFDGAVTIAPGAFVVDKLGVGGGAVTTSDAAVLNGSGQTVVTLSFSGGFTRGTAGALVDGYYRLTIDGTKITRGGQQLDTNGDGIGGDIYTLGSVEADNFFATFGDTSGDGVVGVAEFGEFRSSFGKSSSTVGYDARFDYENDAAVGISDFGQFRTRFGKPKMTF